MLTATVPDVDGLMVVQCGLPTQLSDVVRLSQTPEPSLGVKG